MARGRISRWLPQQHGAWAFLLVPVLLGVSVAASTPLLAALVVAWVAAYPWSWFALEWSTSGARVRPRYRTPLVAWSAVTVPLALLLVAARPWLVWAGLVYAVAFGVNLWFARRRADRALANDLVFMGQCASAVALAWAVGEPGFDGWMPPPTGTTPEVVWVLTAAVALAFTGSILHVKSLIRERRDPRWSRASVVYHLVTLPLALLLAWASTWWLLVPFVFLAARAVAVPRVVARRATAAQPPLRPAVLGIVEAVGSALLLAGGLAA
jgi:hypothetical protein